MGKIEEARAAAIEIWCDPDATHEEFERGIDSYGDARAMAAIEDLIKKFRPQRMEVIR